MTPKCSFCQGNGPLVQITCARSDTGEVLASGPRFGVLRRRRLDGAFGRNSRRQRPATSRLEGRAFPDGVGWRQSDIDAGNAGETA
jgi:hypothetical protein